MSGVEFILEVRIDTYSHYGDVCQYKYHYINDLDKIKRCIEASNVSRSGYFIDFNQKTINDILLPNNPGNPIYILDMRIKEEKVIDLKNILIPLDKKSLNF